MKKNIKKKKVKPKNLLPDISEQDILKPISLSDIGSNGDPCFGKHYDLSTKECKMCGDSELCAIVLAQGLNTTRDKLQEEKHFKDMDILIDIPAVKKFIRSLKRKGDKRADILNKTQEKYKISREDTKSIYRSILTKNN